LRFEGVWFDFEVTVEGQTAEGRLVGLIYSDFLLSLSFSPAAPAPIDFLFTLP
jgi:hypothetical protein